MMTKKPARITISLGEKEHSRLSSLSEQYDVSLSWLTRQAVNEFLERYGQEETQLPLRLPTRRKAAQ